MHIITINSLIESHTTGLHLLVDVSDANWLVSSSHRAALDEAHLAAVASLQVLAALKMQF